MALTPRLPVELLREVLINSRSHGPHTLASLISVCRLFKSEAEHLLYESVDIQALWPAKCGGGMYIPDVIYNYGTFFPSDAAKKTYTDIFISFLTTVTNNERLAGYVKAFISYEDDRLDSSRDGFWDMFASALANLRNMKTLIFQHIEADLQGRKHVLFSCRAQLETLSWACGPGDWEDMCLFLEGQPSVTVLHVDWRQETELPDGIVPRLKMFIGDYDAVWTVGQTHNLTSLFWKTDIVDPFDFDSSNASPLLNCFHHLKTLELPEDSEPFLPLIAPELKSLERLSFVGSRIRTEDMIKITNLVHVKMSYFESRDDTEIRKCFDNLPHLQTIEICDDFNLKWSRGDDNPQEMEEMPLDWCPINLDSYTRLRKYGSMW